MGSWEVMNKSKLRSYLIIEKSLYKINNDDSLSFCTVIDLEHTRPRLCGKHTSVCAIRPGTSFPRGAREKKNSPVPSLPSALSEAVLMRYKTFLS